MVGPILAGDIALFKKEGEVVVLRTVLGLIFWHLKAVDKIRGGVPL